MDMLDLYEKNLVDWEDLIRELLGEEDGDRFIELLDEVMGYP